MLIWVISALWNYIYFSSALLTVMELNVKMPILDDALTQDFGSFLTSYTIKSSSKLVRVILSSHGFIYTMDVATQEL